MEIPMSLIEGVSCGDMPQDESDEEEKQAESNIEVAFSDFSVKDISQAEGSTREYVMTESRMLYMLPSEFSSVIAERVIRSLRTAA